MVHDLGSSTIINGDGETSRDFTYVENAVQANLKSIFTDDISALNQIYNVACGDRITLNEIIDALNRITGKSIQAKYGTERPGDVKHSEADITNICTKLGYKPEVNFEQGLRNVYEWYSDEYNKSLQN